MEVLLSPLFSRRANRIMEQNAMMLPATTLLLGAASIYMGKYWMKQQRRQERQFLTLGDENDDDHVCDDEAQGDRIITPVSPRTLHKELMIHPQQEQQQQRQGEEAEKDEERTIPTTVTRTFLRDRQMSSDSRKMSTLSTKYDEQTPTTRASLPITDAPQPFAVGVEKYRDEKETRASPPTIPQVENECCRCCCLHNAVQDKEKRALGGNRDEEGADKKQRRNQERNGQLTNRGAHRVSKVLGERRHQRGYNVIPVGVMRKPSSLEPTKTSRRSASSSMTSSRSSGNSSDEDPSRSCRTSVQRKFDDKENRHRSTLKGSSVATPHSRLEKLLRTKNSSASSVPTEVHVRPSQKKKTKSFRSFFGKEQRFPSADEGIVHFSRHMKVVVNHEGRKVKRTTVTTIYETGEEERKVSEKYV